VISFPYRKLRGSDHIIYGVTQDSKISQAWVINKGVYFEEALIGNFNRSNQVIVEFWVRRWNM